MAKVVLGLMGIVLSANLHAEARITYVGAGRYACSGNERECAPIRQKNEELELQRRQLRELEHQRYELRRQSDEITRERQQDERRTPYR